MYRQSNTNVTNITNGIPFDNFASNGNGGNPFGNFQATTTNSLANSNFYNFNKGFLPNQQIIEKIDFNNKGNIMHNNIADNILSEHVTEYQINIDSNDRKLSVYPNPFKFTVTFGGIGPQVIESRFQNNKNEEKTYFEGSPSPIIDRRFKNVKYIKLDYLMLPKIITLHNNNNKYDFDSNQNTVCHLSSFGYLILKIKELSSGRILGTNSMISDDSFIIYPDKCLGRDFVMWVTSNGSRIYNNSNLGNLERLTISILTPSGKQLAIIDSCGKEIDFRILDKPKKDDNLAYSLKKMENILKCYISILIGVVENEINTVTKFEN